MKVLVAGGGIAGLAAAHALLRAGAQVTLLEAGRRLGGKVATERRDGFLIERGPDSFLAARPEALALVRELGLADELVPPREPGGAFVWHEGGLVPLPEGVGLGIPTRVVPFLRTPLLGPREKLRAALEVLLPAERTAGDVSIGAFLRRRLGDAAVDRIAGPLVAAIYGADADELSLDALMPRLREAVARHGSLIRAGLAARRVTAGAAPPVLTLRRGMGSLVDALVARLGAADVRLGCGVVHIERSGAGYAARAGGGPRLVADAVILAVPAPEAARALAGCAPAARTALMEVPYRGTAVVSLAYDGRHFAAPERGHGFVVPSGMLAVNACTWTSAKWPGRAPEGTVLLRATLGPQALGQDGVAPLVEAAHDALRRAMGISAAPVFAHVTRWDGAMPRYTVGHLVRLARIDAALAPLPRLALAGAAYRGSGVADCIAQGEAAAAAVLDPAPVPADARLRARAA